MFAKSPSNEPGSAIVLFHCLRSLPLLAAALLFVSTACMAVSSEPLRKMETRVLGRFALPKPFKLNTIKVESSQLILLEEFVPKPLPAPKGFSDWTPAKKNQWYRNWLDTEAGKKFQAAEESRFKKLKKHETTVQKGFEFKFSQVKPGQYDLAGEMVVNHDSKKYFTEFYAKVVVSEVEEINLDRIDLRFFRILRVGDKLPEFEFNSVKNKKVNNKKVSGRNSLFVFWSPGNPFSQTLIDEIAKLKDVKDFQVIAVAIGEKEPHLQFLKSGRFARYHGWTKDLDSGVCQAFGISSLPSVWLSDQDGKIILAHKDFAVSNFKIEKLVLEMLRKKLF